MKPISLFLLFILFSLRAFAWYPLGRNFTPMATGGGTQNWSVMQLPDGRMVFGNNNGMLIYDGDQWQQMPVPNYTTVRSVLYDDARHRIYVGASDEFGYFSSNPRNHHLQYSSLTQLLPEGKRTVGEVWKVLLWNKQIVFQTKYQLLIYNPSGQGEGSISTVSAGQSIETSVVHIGQVYVATSQGLYHINKGHLAMLPGCDAFRTTTVRQLIPYGQGLLVATADHGLFYYNGKDAQPFLPELTPFFKANTVFCAALSGQRLVVGTVRQGAVVRDLKTGQTTYANTATGLANNTVLCATFDQMGNVWLGLDKGVGYLLQNMPYASLLARSSDIGTGYASAQVGSQFYLGTNQGLFVMPSASPSTAVTAAPHPVSGVSGQVWSLYKAGDVLLCGADKGAYVVRGGMAVPIAGMAGTWGFRPIPHGGGLLLACDYDGFVVLQPSGGGYVVRNRLKGADMSGGNFEFDADGSLWVAHWRNGVYRIVLSDDKQQVVSRKQFGKDRGLLVDEGNVINKIGGCVLVSSVDGLHRYAPATGGLVADEALSRVFSRYGQAYQLEEMGNGDLWAMSPQFVGLASRQQKGAWRVDTLSFNGIRRQLQLGLGHLNVLDDHRLLLNDNDGFLLIDTRIRTSRTNRRPIIRRVVATDRDTTLYMASLDGQPVALEIPHTLNSIRLEFGVPEYRTQQAISYQYYLEGYDKDWSLPTPQSYKDYTQLGRGTYTFHVRARNMVDGSVTEQTVTLTILPAWYESWVAMVVYLLLILAALWLLVRMLTRRATRQLRMEQEASQQRIKENERRIKEQQAQLEYEKEKREKERIALENEQLEQELQHKASEIADSTMNLIRKNDMLQAIDEQLTVLAEKVKQEEAKPKLVRKISDIRREIQFHQSDDANWDKFAQNFNIVHNHFMDKLTANYPHLKLNDVKLCAYLKMGLSSKEIASLMNTAVRSIETARYRLRKKLQLEAGENLTDFIQHLDERSS